MKKMSKTLATVAAVLAAGMVALPAQAQWTEKYPVTPIEEQDLITAYLAANFGKIGEMAGQAIVAALQDPKLQAKMAQSAISYLSALSKDSTRSQDDRAREVIGRIEAEIAILKSQGYVGGPTGPLNTTIAFSPSFNTVKLTWQADRPNPFTCQLFDGRNIQFVDVLQEADYRVYRNGKLIATLAGANNGRGANLLNAPKFTTAGISVKLSYSMPVKPTPGEIVFYDYDPYQGQLGTPVNYRVEAQRQGCGAFYNAVGTIYIGANTFRTEVAFDGDGNSVPDFIPESTVNGYRMGPPTPSNPGNPGTPTAPPTSGYSFTGGLDCACAMNPNLAKSEGWKKFVADLESDLKTRSGGGISAWPEISAAVTQCNQTRSACTVGAVTIQPDYSQPSRNGFRNDWKLSIQ